MIRPLGARVVVKQIQKDEATLSGIILAHQDGYKPQMAQVVSAGPESKLSHGSTVYFGQRSGQRVTLDGDDLIILRDEEILGIE